MSYSGYLIGVVLVTTLCLSAAGTEPDGALSGYEAFAQEPAISRALVSPDGKHIATLQRLAKDGQQLLFIYDAQDLSKRPTTLGAARMDMRTFYWLNNERLLVRFTQDVDTLQDLGAQTRLAAKWATVDRAGEKWLELPRNRSDRRSDTAKLIEDFSSAVLFDLLPKDTNHILMEWDDDQNRVSDIFKVNINTGTARQVARNAGGISITYMDEDEEPRLATRYSSSAQALIYLGKLKGSKDWIEIGRTVASSESNGKIFESYFLVGGADSNQIYVRSNHASDTAAIYVYDMEKQAYVDMQFQHPRYDATGFRRVLNGKSEPQIVGFTYTGKAGDVYLIDPAEQALYDGINQVLTQTHNTIVSRSRDGRVLVISAVGPRHPETFYLLRNNKLELLGKSMPFLSPEMLADVQWVRYAARDGLEIPALVTVPNGKGPFPVVVNPHGGPVARDYWGFDLWAQLLAFHGYVVIQPQFRSSDGFGRKHLEAGFAQWGLTMQDDLEDAITYLEQRGLADPNRAAIFGWSYGGYAANVGAFRDPNPFHCAIAGAGAADLPYFRAWLADNGTIIEKTYRTTVDGLNPLDHVDSVDVPLLLIHGDKDERVPVAESRKMKRRLEAAGKQHAYVELEGANHFFGTIYYRHWMQMFPAMINWLDNTCGLQGD